jgi:hypothetical protein
LMHTQLQLLFLRLEQSVLAPVRRQILTHPYLWWSRDWIWMTQYRRLDKAVFKKLKCFLLFLTP